MAAQARTKTPAKTPDARTAGQADAPQLEWVKPPLQARSHRTLERILDAAEALLVERDAEVITVAMVASRAKSSVGSLYARFAGKDALLRSVFERFLDQADATAARTLEPEMWLDASLETVFERTLAFTIAVFEERRKLIAALTIHAAQSPDMRGIVERLGTTIAERFHQLLCARGVEIAHPDPAQAIRFTTWTLLSTLEARTLHRPESCPFTGDQIIAEGMQMFLAYLGLRVPGSDPGPSPRRGAKLSSVGSTDHKSR